MTAAEPRPGRASSVRMEDLLDRSPVCHDMEPVRAVLEGRRVMVTGAGGSIGSEIVNALLRCEPGIVIALDNDETHLHDADRMWASSMIEPVLCDIRDGRALDQTVAMYQPDIVFHAAAHKHVPILERFPDEAAKTNVLGTANLLASSRASGVERLVFISTDKAVNPSSAMGASKRFAEMLVQSTARQTGLPYSVVRFGNVLGSRGSVIPTFVEQIRNGGPVTVSDPRMERYFMTIPEAADLVLQSTALAGGGEVFVLDMGDPVKILDVAERLIRLHGLEPNQDVEITFTGTRPGEKYSEVLSESPLDPSSHPRIGVTRPDIPSGGVLDAYVANLGSLLDEGNRTAVRTVLDTVASNAWRHREHDRVSESWLHRETLPSVAEPAIPTDVVEVHPRRQRIAVGPSG